MALNDTHTIAYKPWKVKLNTDPQEPIASLVCLWDLLFTTKNNLTVFRYNKVDDEISVSGVKLSHDIIAHNLLCYNNYGIPDTSISSTYDLWARYGIDIGEVYYDNRSKTKDFVTTSEVGNSYLSNATFVNFQQLFKHNGTQFSFTRYDKDAALYPKTVKDIWQSAKPWMLRDSIAFYDNTPDTEGWPKKYYNAIAQNAWGDYNPPTVGTYTSGKQTTRNIDSLIILCEEDVVFTASIATEQTKVAYNGIALNPYYSQTNPYIIDMIFMLLQTYKDGNSNNVESIRNKLLAQELGYTINDWLEFLQLPFVQIMLKSTYVWVKSSFFADYVTPDNFNQDLRADSDVQHKNIIVGGGDFNRYDDVNYGYATAESNPALLLEQHEKTGEELNLNSGRSEYSRPYTPKTVPSIDKITPKILKTLQPNEELFIEVEPPYRLNSFTSQIIDKEQSDKIKEILDVLINEGDNEDSLIGSIKIEPWARYDDTARDKKRESLYPPGYFDPESRFENADYIFYKDPKSNNLTPVVAGGGQVPIIVPSEGNATFSGRIFSPTVDELWEYIKRLVDGRKPDRNKSDYIENTAPPGKFNKEIAENTFTSKDEPTLLGQFALYNDKDTRVPIERNFSFIYLQGTDSVSITTGDNPLYYTLSEDEWADNENYEYSIYEKDQNGVEIEDENGNLTLNTDAYETIKNAYELKYIFKNSDNKSLPWHAELNKYEYNKITKKYLVDYYGSGIEVEDPNNYSNQNPILINSESLAAGYKPRLGFENNIGNQKYNEAYLNTAEKYIIENPKVKTQSKREANNAYIYIDSGEPGGVNGCFLEIIHPGEANQDTIINDDYRDNVFNSPIVGRASDEQKNKQNLFAILASESLIKGEIGFDNLYLFDSNEEKEEYFNKEDFSLLSKRKEATLRAFGGQTINIQRPVCKVIIKKISSDPDSYDCEFKLQQIVDEEAVFVIERKTLNRFFPLIHNELPDTFSNEWIHNSEMLLKVFSDANSDFVLPLSLEYSIYDADGDVISNNQKIQLYDFAVYPHPDYEYQYLWSTTLIENPKYIPQIADIELTQTAGPRVSIGDPIDYHTGILSRKLNNEEHITQEAVIVDKFVSMPNTFTYSIFEELHEVSRQLQFINNESNLFDEDNYHKRIIENYLPWRQNRDSNDNPLPIVEDEDTHPNIVNMESKILPQGLAQDVLSAWGPRKNPYSLRELEAFINQLKYNLISSMRFVVANFTVNSSAVESIQKNTVLIDLTQEEKTEYNELTDTYITSAGGLFQLHKDYNLDLINPNTRYVEGGRETIDDQVKTGMPAIFNDLNILISKENTYAIDTSSPDRIHRFEEMTRAEYGRDPILPKSSLNFEADDVYMSATGVWKYKFDKIRIPVLESEY
jgi:hypothetical protein